MKINTLSLLLLFFLSLTFTTPVAAKGEEKEVAKELTGMSIVGNDEAPKSLYIVPWKSSEVGVETSLNMMVNKENVLIDKDVFKRELEYYNVSHETSLGGK